jgi:hypothetical protein
MISAPTYEFLGTKNHYVGEEKIEGK